MNWIIMGLGAALLLSLLRLWRCERQLKDWAEQLEETDENSNLRLGTSVRSRAFLRCCRAMNHRLENGQQARIRLENMSRELKYTVSCVSHDIRTPLTGAMGYLQLLENTPDAARQKEYISIIRRRMEDLEGLLEELFLFSGNSAIPRALRCAGRLLLQAYSRGCGAGSGIWGRGKRRLGIGGSAAPDFFQPTAECAALRKRAAGN